MAKLQLLIFILPSSNKMDVWNLQHSFLKTDQLFLKETQLLYKQKLKFYQIPLLKLIGILNCLNLSFLPNLYYG